MRRHGMMKKFEQTGSMSQGLVLLSLHCSHGVKRGV
jgi:hypothetical protein